MLDTFEATEPRILGLFQNEKAVNALIHELFGEDSSKVPGIDPEISKIAKQGAKIWSETTENMRLHFNNAGGQIGKLDNWHMPQAHSQRLVSIAGRDEWIKSLPEEERLSAKVTFKDPPKEWAQDYWVRQIMDKLDRKQYVHEDGRLYNNQEMVEYLKEVWNTISTGGANKIEPGKITGRGMLANAHAEERSIHFKDAKSYIEYQKQFGATDPYSTMMKHLRGISHDTAIIETFGPNPDLQFKYWLDKSLQEDTLGNPKNAGRIRTQSVKTQDLYDYISGKTLPVANWKIAQGFDTLRNWLVATRLGSAYITSITDNATMQITAAYNGIPALQLFRNQLKTLNRFDKEELQLARRAGLSLNTLMGEMNRWGIEALGPAFSGKMANLTMRLSLLNQATEARRRAFGVTMYGSIGSVVKKLDNLEALEGGDKRLLEAKGVTENTFQIWKKAKLENWGDGNNTMLTPESIYRIPDEDLRELAGPELDKLTLERENKISNIEKSALLSEEQKSKSIGEIEQLYDQRESRIFSDMRREAAIKLLGTVNEEVNTAVIEPGARERVLTKMGTQRGTWKGEIVRSFFLFKSFPITMIMRHWARALAMQGPAARAAYIGSFIAGTTLLGAAAQQVANLVAGRDPQDMTNGKFWASAFLKGGSLGIYGDFLMQSNTSYGNTPLAVLSGPVAGYVEDLIGLTQGNLIQAAQGKRTNAGAEAIQFLKNNIPLQNLWYTKAVTDRLIFNQLQEMVSPGYMRRVEQRAKKDYKQSYWYKPGQVMPSRAPDLEKAVGNRLIKTYLEEKPVLF